MVAVYNLSVRLSVSFTVSTWCVLSPCRYMKCSTSAPSMIFDSTSVQHRGLLYEMLWWSHTATWRCDAIEIHVVWILQRGTKKQSIVTSSVV